MDIRWQTFGELDAATFHAIARLRQNVFVVEQACAYADLDGRDDVAHHLTFFGDGRLLGALRAFAPVEGEAVLGRVVVAAEARGRGLGAALMRQGASRLRSQYGRVSIRIGAQARLQSFYEALGYERCGPDYDEDGILHLPMRNLL